MSSRSRASKPRASSSSSTPATLSSNATSGTLPSGVSQAYYKELKETFQLYDTDFDHRGLLSLKRLRLAMRTLGFEATMEDIEEIVQEMPSLSIHKALKRKARKAAAAAAASRKGKGVDRTMTGEIKESKDTAVSKRRSSRTAAVASRTVAGERSKYAESDDDDDDDEGLRGGGGEDDYTDNDDDEDDDAYDDVREGRDSGVDAGAGSRSDWDDGELFFTFQDFMTIMIPSEEQHGQDEVSRVFQLFDTHGKGSINLEDLRRVAAELNEPVKDEDLREMLEEVAKDSESGVTEQDFKKLMKKVGL
ncbi:hypothetical protein BGZ99_003996 [Dissophora globulifera]|uniref:EF-hand domain-containing protein n=1 Tax=Dissophora globulifera TaxID=979702 RepID=A0A9P6V089_9FUNG|nr:hypothetical protein BGZ99_003996 [Dissophora globulifera]